MISIPSSPPLPCKESPANLSKDQLLELAPAEIHHKILSKELILKSFL